MVASALAGLCFWRSAASPWLLIVAPLLCYVRLWLNMLDGMVALASHQASARGDIVNDLPDRISDVLIFAGVAHSGFSLPYSGYWTAILALMTAYVGMLGQAVGVHREFSGAMSKPWRMVVLQAGAWSAAAGRQFAAGPGPGGPTILDWTCIVIIADASRRSSFVCAASCRRCTRRQQEAHDERATPALERTMKTWDGATLFYRAWLPQSPSNKALILFHRGHEHSARWQDVVDALALNDVAIFAWDARGHGRSPGERGAADSVAALVKDAEAFASHITSEYGPRRENRDGPQRGCRHRRSVGARLRAAAWRDGARDSRLSRQALTCRPRCRYCGCANPGPGSSRLSRGTYCT